MNKKPALSTTQKLHNYLFKLSLKRTFPNDVVTADDAHKYLDTLGVPKNVRTRLSFINSVLREPNFAPVGTKYSLRSKAKGRAITEWSAN